VLFLTVGKLELFVARSLARRRTTKE